MVEKVAKVRALRETFIEQLGGMYEAEEVDVDIPQEQPEIVQQKEPEAIDVESETVSINDL